jgi:Uma2 family endonuclease
MEAFKLDIKGKYTYADYAKWETDERYELIDGVPYMMAGPSSAHQDIAGEVFYQLKNRLKDKQCRPYIAPYDVCLFGKDGDDETVVQPDVLVVCDKSKIKKNYLNGAPDFVIEVLSPSSLSKDQILKLNKYMQAGVREYWTIDPESRITHVYIFNGNHDFYIHYENDTIPVRTLDGCSVNMREVFGGVIADEGDIK